MGTRQPTAWLVRTPIAHRGLHRRAVIPENSLAAFRNAMEHGFPIELDVRELADGEVVVFHDANLERLTGRPGLVREQSAAELAELRLLGTEERVPLLPDVLRLVNGQVPLLVEIKNGTERVGPLEDAVASLLAAYPGEFAVQSFNPRVVRYFQDHWPQVMRGQLAHEVSDQPPDTDLAHLLADPEFRPDFVAYAVDDLPNGATDAVRSRNLPLIAWTVRTPEQQQKAQQYADNYIFEDVLP